MKHTNKNNRKGLTIALGICIALLTAVLIFMLVAMAGFGNNANPTEEATLGTTDVTDVPEESTEQMEAEQNQITEPEETIAPNEEDVVISTPYATLTYPGQWSGLLQVDQISGDPHRVIFTANLDSGITQELFTIAFGGNQDDAMGVVQVSGKEVSVHVTVEEINPGKDWTDNEISVIYTMQECMNHVLEGLKLSSPQEQPQEPQPVLPPEDDEVMAIPTPVCELQYPARWKDYLKLEVLEDEVYTLEFYVNFDGLEPVHLFSIYLGGDRGIHVTDITAADGSVVKLFVDIFELEPDSNWTDSQKAIALAMQEDINFLLSELN